MLLHTRVFLVEQLEPAVVSTLVGTLLSLDEFIILIEAGLLHGQRIVTPQGVGRNPSLDRRTTPTIDNDALRHMVLLIHTFTQKGANGREEPCILLGQRLPVDGSGAYVVLHPMGIRFVLHSEQTHLVVIKSINLICILRIDTLNGHVNVRLARAEPDITYQDIGDFPHLLPLTTYF